MARSYLTSALDNSLRLNQIAELINGRFTEVLGFLDASIPNTSHSIPNNPSAGQFLSASDANTLIWNTVTNLIRDGQASTAYNQDDLILFNQNLFLCITSFTSGDPFDPDAPEVKRIDGLSDSEVFTEVVERARFKTNYADSAPTRTYSVVDGERYFIDSLSGGITTEDFQIPALAANGDRFEFTVKPRGRDFTANSLTVDRNSSDPTAQFFALNNPTTLINDSIELVTNGEYHFDGERVAGQSKWYVTKRDAA